MSRLRRLLNQPEAFVLKRGLLLARGLAWAGLAHRCSVCGWRVRGFAHRWSLTQTRPGGYCPRCNAKARHRRDILFLERHAGLGERPLRVLEIAPTWAMARRLQRTPGVAYTGLDLQRAGPHTTLLGDVGDIPMADGSVDLVVCIHVLEHVPDDRRAIAELHRVLAPGGHALVTVPLDRSRPTEEDPDLTDAGEQRRRFGEPGHVRIYGPDLRERLEAAGFRVQLHPAEDLPEIACATHGLRRDEHVWWCARSTS